MVIYLLCLCDLSIPTKTNSNNDTIPGTSRSEDKKPANGVVLSTDCVMLYGAINDSINLSIYLIYQLCYVALCFVLLCCVVFCYVLFCFVLLCYFMSSNITISCTLYVIATKKPANGVVLNTEVRFLGVFV